METPLSATVRIPYGLEISAADLRTIEAHVSGRIDEILAQDFEEQTRKLLYGTPLSGGEPCGILSTFGPMAPVPSEAERERADALRERETARIEEYRRTGKFPNR